MKKEQILKPMSVARHEFINSLVDLINTCMLPPFVIEDVLRDTYAKVSALSKQQLENDLASYQSALEGASKKNIPV